ncbi:MAG: dihydrodipicolinate synthase family protein [Nitrospinota bacterium]
MAKEHTNSFRGVVGTPVTPFTKDNKVDLKTFQKLVNFLIENGIHALSIPMHIGESLNLTMEERKKVAEAALEAVDGRVPTMVNTSLPGTDQVVSLSRHAEKIGCSAVVVITPYHWQPPPEAILDHFITVASAVSIPVLGYNYPERLGVSLTLDVISKLIEHRENFVGLKDASFNMEYFTEACRITSELRPGFSMFVGIEYMLPSMVVGGAGSFSACGAVAPKLIHNLYHACADGDFRRARDFQHKLSRLWSVIKVGYPSTIKAAMEIMGRPVGDTRKPITPLGEEAKSRLRRQLAEFGILEEEPRGW